MAFTFACGFECGVHTTAGTHLTSGGGVAFSTTTVRTGARSLRINPSASVVYAQNSITAAAVMVMRCYVNVASAPTSDAFICGFVRTAGGDYGLGYKSSDGKYYACGHSAGTVTTGATGVTMAAGWNLVDIRVNMSANPHLVDVQVGGNAAAQYSEAIAGSTANTLQFGNSGVAETFDIFFDDVMLGDASGDYPIGAGFVTAHSPNRDGTHTGTTTNFQRGNAGANITVTTIDAYLLVDEIPLTTGLETSDHISQITSAATQYAEIGFASTTTLNAPQGISVLIGGHRGSTAVAHARWEWNDGGTTATIGTMFTVSGVSTKVFLGAQYSSRPGGGAWTSAAFNNLLLRFGYSTDATPDVYFDQALIEAAFSNTGAGAVALGNSTLVASGTISNITSNWVHLTPIVASI